MVVHICFVFVFDKQNDVIVPVDDIVVGGIFRRLLPSDSCRFERICQEYCKNLSIFRFALLELLNCHIDIFLAIAAAVWQSPLLQNNLRTLHKIIILSS